ncbi:MAG: kinase/pyrophosphorylase [Eggerthellaceae bacterium]|nr:kinase/pyrophosphorylase [Eggerthellaceae bacterium]
METIQYGAETSSIPTIHVISDSVGTTASAIARAAAAQFGETEPRVELLPNVRSFEEVRDYLLAHAEYHRELYGKPDMIVLYTIIDAQVNEKLRAFFAEYPQFAAVDLMTDAVASIKRVSGMDPILQPGELHATDERYFNRIEAMEFTIEHDDGRNPQDLTKADIVLLGVSRCGKTPISIYLSQEGYRVSNVPLDLQSAPPRQLYDVDPSRLFGLMTTSDVLVDIRRKRLGRALSVASSYAEPEQVVADLDEARALMRRLGCIVIHTEHRAVEETAQEILRFYEMRHPRSVPRPR